MFKRAAYYVIFMHSSLQIDLRSYLFERKYDVRNERNIIKIAKITVKLCVLFGICYSFKKFSLFCFIVFFLSLSHAPYPFLPVSLSVFLLYNKLKMEQNSYLSRNKMKKLKS